MQITSGNRLITFRGTIFANDTLESFVSEASLIRFEASGRLAVVVCSTDRLLNLLIGLTRFHKETFQKPNSYYP